MAGEVNDRAYYNENDPFAAAWLRNLIAENLIAPGDVDERSIVDVKANDLRGYTQCHFFAGIGGWSYALRLADWSDGRPIWTGSCPCQPLSGAGLRKGHVDERHLWPTFHDLIAECRPPIVAGEQVASKDGREWFAGVRADLEALGYACGCADLCAALVGSPTRGHRLHWVASPNGDNRAEQNIFKKAEFSAPRWHYARRCSGSFWSSAIKMEGADGSWRWVEPGISILADGVPDRVAKHRAIGNAIVPQLAAEFIKAMMDCIPMINSSRSPLSEAAQ